jgi:hypothetical protein
MRGRQVRRDVGRGFFVSPGRGTGGADIGPIHAPQLPIDVPFVVELDLQRFDDGGKDSAPTPAEKMAIHRLPGTEAFGQIPPRSARGENPENTVELRSSIACRTPGAGSAQRQMRLDQRPLLIRELVAFHEWRPPCRHRIL